MTVNKRDGQAVTGEVATYVYDKLGNLDKVILPNGVISDYDYDALNRLTALTEYTEGSGGPVGYQSNDSDDVLKARYAYTLQADGMRTFADEQVRQTNGSYTHSGTRWAYNALGRLISEATDDVYSGTFSADRTDTYAFDLAGNRASKTTDTSGYDVAVTYKYDDNDRLTEEKSDSTNDADDRFTQYAYGTGTQQTNKSADTRA